MSPTTARVTKDAARTAQDRNDLEFMGEWVSRKATIEHTQNIVPPIQHKIVLGHFCSGLGLRMSRPPCAEPIET
jgi:hypothetical protein